MSTFNIGDKVTFTKVTRKGRGFNFKSITGKIEMFSRPEGKKALVKYAGGNTAWVKLDGLRLEGQRNTLTEMFLGKEGA